MSIQKQLPKFIAAYHEGERDGRNNVPYRGQYRNAEEIRAYQQGYREGQLIRAAAKRATAK